ncbi:MAG: TlpA family protein disulfide reductase [Sedimentisphaerales bacterium]|nr:TlpA family protein disulfide reductase [Sedimentisphaerales bacterium]
MRRITGIVLLVITTLLVLTQGCSRKQPNYGKAPDFTLPDTEGNPVSLSDFKGKVIIVAFWTTWCPGCVKEIPHFIELKNKYKDSEFDIIGISLDEGGAEDVKPFLKTKPVNYNILIGNTRVSNSFDTKGILPTVFVIDKTGQIRRKYVGSRGIATFEKDVKAFLAEPETATKSNDPNKET